MNATTAPRVGTLLAGFLLCVALTAALAIGNWTPSLPAIPTWAQDTSPWLLGAAQILNVLGRTLVLTPISVAVVIALWLRGHRRWASYVAACGVLGVAAVEMLKRTLDRPRPEYALLAESSSSFPSGHAAAGIYAWCVFAIVLWFLLPRHLRWWATVPAVLGLLMGPSRVVLGVHYATDVLAGWAVGAGAVLAVSAAFVAWPPASDDGSAEAAQDQGAMMGGSRSDG